MSDPVVLDSKYGVQVWSAHGPFGITVYWVIDRNTKAGRKFGTKRRFASEQNALSHAYSLIVQYASSV